MEREREREREMDRERGRERDRYSEREIGREREKEKYIDRSEIGVRRGSFSSLSHSHSISLRYTSDTVQELALPDSFSALSLSLSLTKTYK